MSARSPPPSAACGAALPGIVAVRDSKDREGPALIFGTADWQAFTTQLQNGAFDLR